MGEEIFEIGDSRFEIRPDTDDSRAANSAHHPHSSPNKSRISNLESRSNSGSDKPRISNLESLPLLRLLQLVSPALPIGAYHFSQGLEYAVQVHWVHDELSTYAWIDGVAREAIGTLDIPVLLRLHRAWAADEVAVDRWSRFLIAARETAELRAEERHMGRALAKVLVELEIADARSWIARDHTSYAAMFALAAARWSIDAKSTAQAYLWAWTENQVLAALKLLPVGQSAGQRILNRVIPSIPEIVHRASSLDDDDIGIATPLHGMSSAWHETQYSRLFRS